MELIKFIQDNKIDNYEVLKNALESPTFNLKIKEDSDFPTLFLIHTQDTSNLSLKLVNESNGIILDKSTLKIVCYTFDKCDNSLSFPSTLDVNNLFVEPSFEGTLIRLYFYNGSWIFSTKKCIDARKARWLSNKNFVDMFFDCGVPIEILNSLNPNYCYSFIVTHPENNIVVKYAVPTLYHISTRDMNTMMEIDQNIGILKIERKPIHSSSLEETMTQILNTTQLSYEGFIFIDTNYNRWKLKIPIFMYVRELWGNSNNRFFRYLELRKDKDLLNEYVKYFPDDKERFLNYELKISDIAKHILSIYISRHVTKEVVKIPFYFYKLIYNLHGDYLKDKIKTDHNKIMLKLLELDAKKLCFIINNYDKNIDKMNDKMNDEMMEDNVILNDINEVEMLG
jgi:hypothetical protein